MQVKSVFSIFGILLMFQHLNAQIKDVNYKLKFNEQTNLFDCYLVIKDGSAHSLRERAQFNAQYSLIVPAGSKVELAKNYMPIQNNQKYEGNKPMEWTISNVTRQPASDPFSDYVSIIPALSPASFYNDLKQGDVIKLFSLRISPLTNCGNDVKIFDNAFDPDSGARGMSGGDYSNGFTIGGIDQKYSGNEVQEIPTIDAIKDLTLKYTKNKLEFRLDVRADQNYTPLSYAWSGPNGFTSSSRDISIVNPTSEHQGMYKVEITDARGCKQVREIETNIKTENITTPDKKSAPSESIKLDGRSLVAPSKSTIYPNPANNNFNIKVEGSNGSKVNVDIMDINGRTISKSVFKSVIQDNVLESNIPLNNIQPGIYNISISVNEEVSTHKLIVIR